MRTRTLAQLRHNNHLAEKANQRLNFWVTTFMLTCLALAISSFVLIYYKHDTTAVSVLGLALGGMLITAHFGKKKV